MASRPARVQLCGRLTVEINGRRREGLLPGPQGRLLFTFLVLHRHEETSRARLADALWPTDQPDASDTAIYALLSRCRAAVGPELLSARGPVRLCLPEEAWIDLEAARDGAHRAESALALGEWARAWGAAQTCLFAARRGFLPDVELDWVAPVREELADLYLRSLETYAAAALELGSTELATAERAGRELVSIAPFRESGYRLLMRALATRGNPAEALRVYDRLQRLLRDELGVSPSADTRRLHGSIVLDR